MKKLLSGAQTAISIAGVSIAAMTMSVLSPAQAGDVVTPTVISGEDFKANVFARPGVVTKSEKSSLDTDYTSKDFMPFTSSDKKFFVGMFQTEGHHRYDIDKPYGVDEYMHFLKGGVTLTSSDGTVTEIKAGDSVMIPKEWTGVWESHGYEKIYVIYDTSAAAE